MAADPLMDETLIRAAWKHFTSERQDGCDELNSFVGACMELLRLERERVAKGDE